MEKRPLYRAMLKYGIENFELSLIEETNNPEERERFWIEQKGSFKNGYNATLGGDGKKLLDYDLIVSEYSEIQNIKLTAKKLNISIDSVKTALNSRNVVLKSSSQIVKENSSKIVKMFDLDGNFICSFPSIKDAARYLSENKFSTSKDINGITKHIRDCANLKRKTAYSHIWKWN